MQKKMRHLLIGNCDIKAILDDSSLYIVQNSTGNKF